MTTLPPEVAGSLMQVAYACTRDDAKRHLLEAMRRGLPVDTAAQVLDQWAATNTPQVIGARRCHCGRPIPTTSLDGTHCCEHDQEIPA